MVGGEQGVHGTLMALRERLARHIREQQIEILVALDATDPLTGTAFQSRHSFTADDLVFDHMFAPCLAEAPSGRLSVDWDAFHMLVPAPFGEAMPGESLREEDDRVGRAILASPAVGNGSRSFV